MTDEQEDDHKPARCRASVFRGRMGPGRCTKRAKNGDLCHAHARKEDIGKFVPRVKKPRKGAQ